jgi:hypothetical protein
MRILLILISIAFITAVKADEIYNLIKIPNLDIYKIDTKNKIRYLNTSNDFRIGLEKNITCARTDPNNLSNKFLIIKKNLNSYSPSFLKKNNIRYLVMCENLFISNINTGGIPDTKKRTLVIDINFNPKYFERMIHHEIFHMIQKSNSKYFDEEKWVSLNTKDFEYAKCSTCSDRLNLDLYKNTEGFLTEYSKSIPSEDMAEVFSFLMTDKAKVEDKSDNDIILKNKINFIKSSLSKIDSSFKF